MDTYLPARIYSFPCISDYHPNIPVGDHLSLILSFCDSGGLIILSGSQSGHVTQDWSVFTFHIPDHSDLFRMGP